MVRAENALKTVPETALATGDASLLTVAKEEA
jgi:hypothetical protein